MPRPTKAQLNRAVSAMQIYLGSVGSVRLKDEERLCQKVTRAINKIVERTGMDFGDAWDQIGEEAHRKGLHLATPGKDI